MRKRLLALISLNALVVAVALMMTGGTAAEMADTEMSSQQSLTAARLDIVPDATAAVDLELDFSGLTNLTTKTQSFSVTNTASPTMAADIYVWLDPAAGFPFCAGTQPIDVTIADHTSTNQTVNICDLVNDADGSSAGLSDGARAPLQIADGVAGGVAVQRSMQLTLDPNAVPADWSLKTGSAVLTVAAVQDGGPAPVVAP